MSTEYEGVLLEWLSGIKHRHNDDWGGHPVGGSERQRHVSFLSDDVMEQKYDILSLNDYSPNEIKACWYTPTDKAKMKMKHEVDVARFESGLPPRGGRHATSRGLEAWSVEGGAELELNIHRCVDSVMDEQDRQWSTRCDDHNRIAVVSIQATTSSKRLAYEIGKFDADEAAAIYNADKQAGLDARSSHSLSSTGTASTSGSFDIDNLNCYEIPLSASSSYGKKKGSSSCRRRNKNSSSSRTKKHPDSTTVTKLVSSVQKCVSQQRKNNTQKMSSKSTSSRKAAQHHPNQKVVVIQNYMLPKKVFSMYDKK